MDEKNHVFPLEWEKYKEPGLYLVFQDNTRLALTENNIEAITRKYWTGPGKIPSDVKTAAAFQRCDFCPLKGEEDFCDALRPVLPLLEVIDNFTSFDPVTTVYRGNTKDLWHVSNTTLQRALRYISSMSLMSYCRVGRQFQKYYAGIIPVMESERIANRLYLNIYWIHQGDPHAVDEIISTFSRTMTVAIQNQMQRLRLICKNDAFLNAYVLTHMVTDVLNENRDRKLTAEVEALEANHSREDA